LEVNLFSFPHRITMFPSIKQQDNDSKCYHMYAKYSVGQLVINRQ